jgi:hypothetical protein
LFFVAVVSRAHAVDSPLIAGAVYILQSKDLVLRVFETGCTMRVNAAYLDRAGTNNKQKVQFRAEKIGSKSKSSHVDLLYSLQEPSLLLAVRL